MHWKREYSIGIDVMDQQHERIFEHMLSIENSLVKNDPWNILQFQIIELERSLNFHFAVEESLLQIIRYPELEEHRVSHEKLIEALHGFEKKVKDSRAVADLLVFFEDWFVSHVLSEDMLFADYSKKCMEHFPHK